MISGESSTPGNAYADVAGFLAGDLDGWKEIREEFGALKCKEFGEWGLIVVLFEFKGGEFFLSYFSGKDENQIKWGKISERSL